MLQGIKKGIAVDLGCNNGKYTSQLALYFEEIFGLDYAEKALFSAPKKQNITYEVIDLNINANKLLKYRNVDKYVAIAIFELLENPEDVIRNISLSLRQGGDLFIVIPNNKSLNFLSFRFLLLLKRWMGREAENIYNNGINLKKINKILSENGFEITKSDKIIASPVYLINCLPALVQTLIVKIDPLLLKISGGGYKCLIATKK